MADNPLTRPIGGIPAYVWLGLGGTAVTAYLLLRKNKTSSPAATQSTQTALGAATSNGAAYGQPMGSSLQPFILNQGAPSQAQTPGQFQSVSATRDPASGQYDVLGLTQAGSVEHAWWDPRQGKWGGWENLSQSGQLTPSGPVTGPAQTPGQAEQTMLSTNQLYTPIGSGG